VVIGRHTLVNKSLISIRPAPVFRKCHALGSTLSFRVAARFSGAERLSALKYYIENNQSNDYESA